MHAGANGLFVTLFGQLRLQPAASAATSPSSASFLTPVRLDACCLDCAVEDEVDAHVGHIVSAARPTAIAHRCAALLVSDFLILRSVSVTRGCVPPPRLLPLAAPSWTLTIDLYSLSRVEVLIGLGGSLRRLGAGARPAPLMLSAHPSFRCPARRLARRPRRLWRQRRVQRRQR